MNKAFSWIGAALLLAVGAAGAQAKSGHAKQACHDDDMAGARTPVGRVAVAWLTKAFNEQKMGEAFDLYMSRTDYFNHSGPPTIGESFEEQREGEIKAMVPDGHFNIVQVVAQGNLVAVHVQVTHSTSNRVNELVEFMRVHRGKIVDHWDLHGPVPENGRQFVKVNRFSGK